MESVSLDVIQTESPPQSIIDEKCVEEENIKPEPLADSLDEPTEIIEKLEKTTSDSEINVLNFEDDIKYCYIGEMSNAERKLYEIREEQVDPDITPNQNA